VADRDDVGSAGQDDEWNSPSARYVPSVQPQHFDRNTLRGTAMGANTKIVSDQSFDSDVLNADGPVLVDFWAEWCGPCRQVAPVLEEIAGEQAGKLTIAKLNIDENPETARKYQVMSIPTMAVFSGGELVKTIVGARPKAAILRELSDFVA
jgi:thioredoxin 1